MHTIFVKKNKKKQKHCHIKIFYEISNHICDYVHGEVAVTFNEQTWLILKNLAWNKDQNNAKNW